MRQSDGSGETSLGRDLNEVGVCLMRTEAWYRLYMLWLAVHWLLLLLLHAVG